MSYVLISAQPLLGSWDGMYVCARMSLSLCISQNNLGCLKCSGDNNAAEH